MSSDSSSLKTDSDWDESESYLETQYRLRATPVRSSIQMLGTENFADEMLKQIRNEVKNNPDSSISLESSLESLSEDEIIENDSIIRTDKISEVNNHLAKEYIQAIMAFKASARPMLASFSKRRGGVILSPDLISTIEPGQTSVNDLKISSNACESTSYQEKTKNLAASLKQIQELKKIRQNSVTCIQNQLNDLKSVEEERLILKHKLNQLSCSLDTIISDRRATENKCSCYIF